MTLTINTKVISEIVASWLTPQDARSFPSLTDMVKDFYKADNLIFATIEDEIAFRQLAIRFMAERG